MKYHYVYLLTLHRGKSYIGGRSCKCRPENDSYYGSSVFFDGSDVYDKEILKTFTKRKTAMAYEVWLHKCYDVSKNKYFANRARQTSTLFHCDRTGQTWKNKPGFMAGESNNFFGKKHSEKTKRHLSKTHTGKKHSEETCKKMAETRKLKTIYKVVNIKTGEIFIGNYNSFRVGSNNVFNRGRTYVHKLLRVGLGKERSGFIGEILK